MRKTIRKAEPGLCKMVLVARRVGPVRKECFREREVDNVYAFLQPEIVNLSGA
jgi:hypothetical protein